MQSSPSFLVGSFFFLFAGNYVGYTRLRHNNVQVSRVCWQAWSVGSSRSSVPFSDRCWHYPQTHGRTDTDTHWGLQIMYTQRGGGPAGGRERDTERERQRDTERERDRERQTDRHRDRRDRRTDRQRLTERLKLQTQRERGKQTKTVWNRRKRERDTHR